MYGPKDFQKITRIVKSHIHGLQALYLFGSYARGTADAQSDADLAAILESYPERTEKLRLVTKLSNNLAENGYATDIVFKDKRLYDVDKEIPGTLAYTIHREGKVLWQSSV